MPTILEWFMKVFMWLCGTIFAMATVYPIIQTAPPESKSSWTALLFIFLIVSAILLFLEAKRMNWKPEPWQKSKTNPIARFGRWLMR